VFHLRSIISEYESKSNEFEAKMNELNQCIDGLKQDLSYQEEEKQNFEHDLAKQAKFYEKKLAQLEKELEIEHKVNQEHKDQIKNLLRELDEKTVLNEKQNTKKQDEMKRLRQNLNLANEKLKYLELRTESELDSLRKKHQKELDQMRFQLEQGVQRNGDLSKSNGEMRKKLSQFEQDFKELNEKYFMTKHNLDSISKQKKDLKEELDRTSFNLKKEIHVLEQLRDEYLKKNSAQQFSIQKMCEQTQTFQTEISKLIKLNQELNDKLLKSSSMNDAYRKKYSDLKSYVKKLLIEEEDNLQKSNLKQQEAFNTQANMIKMLIRELNLEDE
jgi:hypothetical protein